MVLEYDSLKSSLKSYFQHQSIKALVPEVNETNSPVFYNDQINKGLKRASIEAVIESLGSVPDDSLNVTEGQTDVTSQQKDWQENLMRKEEVLLVDLLQRKCPTSLKNVTEEFLPSVEKELSNLIRLEVFGPVPGEVQGKIPPNRL